MLISDRFSCATAVMDTIARMPTIIVVRFIEHFDSIRPPLMRLDVCDAPFIFGSICTGYEVHGSHEHFLQREAASCDLPHDCITIDSKHRISLQGKSHTKRRGTRK